MPTIKNVGEDIEKVKNVYTIGENTKWYCFSEEWLGILL